MSRYIVFEGLDGGGKDTAIELVKDWLEESGRTVFKTRTPSFHPVGEACRNYFQNGRQIFPNDETRAVFFGALMGADMLQHDLDVQAEMEEGGEGDQHWVLCSRTWISTWCYQGSNQGTQGWVMREVATRLIPPQAVFWFHADIDVCMKRIRERDRELADAFEYREMLEAVQTRWEDLNSFLESPIAETIWPRPPAILNIDTTPEEMDPMKVLETIQQFLSKKDLVYGA